MTRSIDNRRRSQPCTSIFTNESVQSIPHNNRYQPKRQSTSTYTTTILKPILTTTILLLTSTLTLLPTTTAITPREFNTPTSSYQSVTINSETPIPRTRAASIQDLIKPKSVEGGFEPDSECYQLVVDAAESDGIMDQDDYLTFLDLHSNNYFADMGITSYSTDLPLVLINNFNELSCTQCTIFAIDCTCQEEMDVSAAAKPENERTDGEKIFLFELCQETFDAIKLVQTPAPSLSPTPPLVSPRDPPTTRERATIPFVLGNTAGIDAQQWRENSQGLKDILDRAFGTMVEGVLDDMNEDSGGERRKKRRKKRNLIIGDGDFSVVHGGDEYEEREYGRLLELIYVASWTDSFEDVDCPPGSQTGSQCQSMNGNVYVDVVEPEEKTVDDIANAINDAMEDQGLFPNGSSGIEGLNVFVRVKDDNDQEVIRSFVTNRGAFYGTITGAAAVTILVAAFVYRFRSRVGDDKSSHDGLGASPPHGNSTSVYSSRVGDFSSMSEEEEDQYMAEEGKLRYNRDLSLSMEESHEGSSNAGSSGWSSSAGVSSIHTGSVDSMEYTFGATLASIGAASGLHNRYGQEDKITDKIYSVGVDDDLSMDSISVEDTKGMKNPQSITRKDLNQAIDAGDWAAVGATAALLAQRSDTRSVSSYSAGSGILSSNFSTSATSTERARAEELDHLMDTGDWEGVVLAAAKFEAETTDKQVRSDRPQSSGNQSMADRSISNRSVATSSINSPSVSTSVSESPSNAQRLAEIRREVEALVRRVVPDEIDHIDEMMNQFHGREEELVETLRTMQERNISRRAKEAVRKNAKREARKNVKSNKGSGLPPSGMGLPPSGPKAVRGIRGSTSIASGSIDNISAEGIGAAANILSKSQATDSKNNEPKDPSNDTYSEPAKGLDLTSIAESSRLSSLASPNRVALDRAIEANDWEAVGEVASRMCDADSSVGTSDYESAYSGKDSFMSSTSRISSSDNSQNLQERSKELETLIENGDWSGVVMAANRYSVAEKNSPGSKQSKDAKMTKGSLVSSSIASSTNEMKNSKRGGFFGSRREQEAVTQEERDALAQAEIWMKIAAQSKNEGSSAKGASDAADWAISRSLTAMRNAEELRERDGTKNSSSVARGVASETSSACDDKSV